MEIFTRKPTKNDFSLAEKNTPKRNYDWAIAVIGVGKQKYEQ